MSGGADSYERAGRWLREQREDRNISVRALAEKLGVSPQAVYQWQDGARPVSPEKANGVAEMFGLRPTDVWANLCLTLPADVDPVQMDRDADVKSAERMKPLRSQDEGDEGEEGLGERAG